jgi:hypothetical protein
MRIPSATSNQELLTILSQIATNPTGITAKLQELQTAEEKVRTQTTEFNKVRQAMDATSVEISFREDLLEKQLKKLEADRLAFEKEKVNLLKKFSEDSELVAKKRVEFEQALVAAEKAKQDAAQMEEKSLNFYNEAVKQSKLADEKATKAEALYQRLTQALSG